MALFASVELEIAVLIKCDISALYEIPWKGGGNNCVSWVFMLHLAKHFPHEAWHVVHEKQDGIQTAMEG